MKTPITYYGGKQQMASTINAIIEQQPHICYNEPFFGGGAVFFHKKPSYKYIFEIYLRYIYFFCNFVLSFHQVICQDGKK